MRRLTFVILTGALLLCARAEAALNWEKTYKDGLTRAKKENKLVMVDLYADWCGPCKILEKETFSDKGVEARLAKDFVVVKIDIDRSKEVIEFAQKYGFDGIIPHIYFFDSDGKKISEVIGFAPATDFLGELGKVAKKTEKK